MSFPDYVQIRRASIIKISEATYRAISRITIKDGLMSDFFPQARKGNGNFFLWIAKNTIKGEIIGWCLMEVAPLKGQSRVMHYHDKKMDKVIVMNVKNKYRKLGIGRRLLETAMKYRRKGIIKVYMHDMISRKFYLSCGLDEEINNILFYSDTPIVQDYD